MFAETLKRVVDNVDGGIAAVVMGLDGIPAGESLQVGGLDEFSVKAQRLLLVCRMLSPQYFVAVVMAPEGNFGKCRYLMRMAQSALVAQL